MFSLYFIPRGGKMHAGKMFSLIWVSYRNKLITRNDPTLPSFRSVYSSLLWTHLSLLFEPVLLLVYQETSLSPSGICHSALPSVPAPLVHPSTQCNQRARHFSVNFYYTGWSFPYESRLAPTFGSKLCV